MRKMICLLWVMLVLSGCSAMSNELPEEKPDDFNFSLKFGITAANELNTYENTFTKDLIEAGTVMTEMVLTDEEMEIIYEKFRYADVVGLPEVEGGDIWQDPYDQFQLVMTVADKEYRLHWDHASPSKEKYRWEEVMIFLKEDIRFSKEEYKSLPEAVGGYD